MIRASRQFISVCIGLLLCAGIFLTMDVPEPAWAATKLTISVSGNVDQSTLDSYIGQIIKKYNINPDVIYIRYSNGTTTRYTPGRLLAPSTPVNPSPAPQPVPPKPEPAPTPASASMTADEQKMLNLVNQARAGAGLPALKADEELIKLARLKAQDMIKRGYFSHTSPIYGSPFDMMKAAGVSYRYAGENLAGAYSVNTAHTNLMNSPGHRANILNNNFKSVGIGIVNGGPYGKMFVQMFIG